ncbi:MAG: hypothetical protein JXA22_04635 [Candidatus Thermoplasmatota archaeon]|nr:hypothetical protein [Candidatus Thermoplasmatota archaeon]
MGLIRDVKCHNCGASLSLKAGEVIITCDFCGTAFNVASGKDFFLEHSILPSNFDNKKVDDIVRTWMGDGPLKPSNLRSRSIITGRSQVFLPFYIVHTNVRTSYKGFFTRGGGREERSGSLDREYYWKVLGRRGSKFPTKEYEIPLSGKEDFNLSKIPAKAKYLNAEFDEKDAQDMTKVEVQDHQRFLIMDQVNEVSEMDHDFEIEDVEFVHAPVWRIDYTYNGSPFQILVCGNTGNVIRGDIPPPDLSVGGFFSDMKRAFFGKRK